MSHACTAAGELSSSTAQRRGRCPCAAPVGMEVLPQGLGILRVEQVAVPQQQHERQAGGLALAQRGQHLLRLPHAARRLQVPARAGGGRGVQHARAGYAAQTALGNGARACDPATEQPQPGGGQAQALRLASPIPINHSAQTMHRRHLPWTPNFPPTTTNTHHHHHQSTRPPRG